jgi:type IV secretion system protein VirB8
MSRDVALATYLEEAASWDADRAAQSQRSARLAWVIASVSLLAALCAMGAVMMLTPLKSVEPFVIRVDNTTGLVDVVPIYTGTAGLQETVTRYLLWHYVFVCERFNFATAESDYQECGAFNSAALNQQWARAWAVSNPQSPLNLYKDGTVVRARVVAITFLPRANGTQDLAQVRYVTTRQTADGGEEQPAHWVATVQYTYAKPPSDLTARQWNPLGLRILDFRREPETPPAENSGTSATVKAGGAS